MLNIALCDDVPVLREMLESIIHDYERQNNIRFNIYQFDSGEELLEKQAEDRIHFDLFFLDYYMKGLTGVDTALRIRRYDTACSIVFVTSSDSRHEFMSANPLQILSKPIQEEEIYKILNSLLADKD